MCVCACVCMCLCLEYLYACLCFHTLEVIYDTLLFCPVYFLFSVLEPSLLGDNQNHLLQRLCLVMFYTRIHFGQPPSMKVVCFTIHMPDIHSTAVSDTPSNGIISHFLYSCGFIFDMTLESLKKIHI